MELELSPTDKSNTDGQKYKILARKYRPSKFSDLLGQEYMVRILTNSFHDGRIAQAFMLSGIRGVGKTTTARIIAKALNCTNINFEDKKIEPCDECSNCKSISENRSQDVLEIDAASHTGIDAMRSAVIESIHYKPLSSKYRIFIIDEVHMLSKSSFNGLLKTLEEPPEHVKFIFATTEINKIPATILSRCQRFDLRRVLEKELLLHLQNIAKNEGFALDEDSAMLISHASEGSVRDGLSILDQAINISEKDNIDIKSVRGMLGLLDKDIIQRILTNLIDGNISDVLSTTKDAYIRGMDPIKFVQDIAHIIYDASKHNIAQIENASTSYISYLDNLCKILSASKLCSLWDVLSKGHDEVKNSYNPFLSLEMLLIRISYMISLDDIEGIISRIKSKDSSGSEGSTNSGTHVSGDNADSPQSRNQGDSSTSDNLCKFEGLLDLCLSSNKLLLYTYLIGRVRIVEYSRNNIIISSADGNIVDNKMVSELNSLLLDRTKESWYISIVESDSDGGSYLDKKRKSDAERVIRVRSNAESNDLVKYALGRLKDSKISCIVDSSTNETIN